VAVPKVEKVKKFYEHFFFVEKNTKTLEIILNCVFFFKMKTLNHQRKLKKVIIKDQSFSNTSMMLKKDIAPSVRGTPLYSNQ